jgi:hypothetical protein
LQVYSGDRLETFRSTSTAGEKVKTSS